MKMWLLGDVSGKMDNIIIKYEDKGLVHYDGKGVR